MSRSILLKDRHGRIGGYVVADGHDVQLRVTEAYEEAYALILYDERGQCIWHQISHIGFQEQYEDCCLPVCAAVVNQNGEVLLSDGSKDIEEKVSAAAREKAGQCCDEQTGEKHKEEIETIDTTDSHRETQARPVPERRWPRPPCMHDAVYESGKWKVNGRQATGPKSGEEARRDICLSARL